MAMDKLLFNWLIVFRTMTMEELLNQMTKKAKVESEEAHRQMVAAMNGLASLHIVKDQVMHL